ncbi:ATP synthase subunit C lysine N-methyltransferase-like isoform X2 [Actinia tenebrosa]|uniref:ATP synthase subunit C lysine N-methyltransferase-like isoform X2 n=1 Tax=Actinia tenebrosa TaxID=6105 RepID=A0A6P8I3E7_ACTTE|nr:ATP synthase subunit C lysine N-methyltransferase-like isoform X2 [Actinia tenebrosa]
MLPLLAVCPCVAELSHKNTIIDSQKATMQGNSPENEIFNPEDLTKSVKPPKRSIFGKVVLGVTGAVALGLVAITTPFVTPALRKICLPYVPATERQVANVLQLCRKGKTHTLVDLGSGDGRVVLAAARHGYLAHGIELNPWLVLYSNIQARWHGLSNLASFSRQDLWKMPQLQEKIQKEVNPDCHVIACRFPFSWRPKDCIQEGIDSVWLYKHPFKENP